MNRSLRSRSAFTLIEVMISVLILALGLLGLGAIVPVIVHEQRRASEQTLGIAAANAAQAYLESRRDLDPWQTSSGWDRWFDTPVNNGTQAWSALPPASSGPTLPDHRNAYLWEPLHENTIAPANEPEIWLTHQGFGVPAGTMYLHRTNATGAQSEIATISLGDRLWPSASMQGVNISTRDAYRPLFVWDFVGRRLPSSARADQWPSVEPQQIQLAIFVRRIDPGIRVPRATFANGSVLTLRDVITGVVPNASDARIAVAVDNNGNITNNGIGRYSVPIVVAARRVANVSDQMDIAGATPEQMVQITQPGQRIVDNLGNIYTVRGPVDGGNGRLVRVDPPIPASVLANTRELNSLRQIVYTPQIPAAIKIVTISRPAQ